MLDAFLVDVTKCLADALLGRKELFSGSQLEDAFIKRRAAWRRELEAAASRASTVRKQRDTDAGTQPTVSFLFLSGPQTMGCCCPHAGRVFSVNPMERLPHGRAQRLLPQVVLSPGS